MTEKDNRTKAEKREAKLKNLEGILTNKFYQNVIGFSTLKRDPHQFGKLGYKIGQASYSNLMNTEEAQKMYSEESEEEKEGLGISETAPASYYVERKVRQMVRLEAFRNLPLGRLEGAVKSVVEGLEFELDDKFRDYIPIEVMIGAAGKEEQGEKLSEDEKYVLSTHKYLQDAYETYLALDYQTKGYVSGLNATGKKLNEGYAKATGKFKEEE